MTAMSHEDNSIPDPQASKNDDTAPKLDTNAISSQAMSTGRAMNNPLIEFNPIIPYDKILPEHIFPAIDTKLQEANICIQKIAQETDPTFDNTMQLLDQSIQSIERPLTIARHISEVLYSDELQKELDRIEPPVAKFFTELATNSELYDTITKFSKTAEYDNLDDNRKAAVDKLLQEMKLAGAGLPENKKAELIQLEEALASLTNEFSSNLLNSTNEYGLLITDQKRLSGLPESALSAAKAAAKNAGETGYKFTLQAPSVIAVLKYADDESLRQEIYTAYSQRATGGKYDNSHVVSDILKRRQQKAELLGYNNIGEYILKERMASTPEIARAMGKRLVDQTQAALKAEIDTLTKFKQTLTGDNSELKPWDISYYSTKYEKQELDFDPESLRPYFSLNNVMQGAFKLAKELYDISVQESDKYPVLDDSVKVYEITDNDGRYLGHFYSDFIVRDSKQNGAWMGLISSTATLHSDAQSAIGLICGNMTAPVDDKPALLTFDEVLTIFHEFGHLLHGLMYRGELSSQNGMNVEWDFIELPSQLKENWCWTRECLDLFAKHYETGAKIPDELFDKLQESRTFMTAIPFQRQLGLAEMDFAIHCDYDPQTDADVVSYARNIENQFAVVGSDSSATINGFHHLMAESTGYACGYYSYRWAAILEADVYEEATAKKVLDSDWGKKYQELVYRNGSSVSGKNIFQALMGRDPDESALLRRIGLA